VRIRERERARERKHEVNIPFKHKENIPFKRDIIEMITLKERIGNFYIFTHTQSDISSFQTCIDRTYERAFRVLFLINVLKI